MKCEGLTCIRKVLNSANQSQINFRVNYFMMKLGCLLALTCFLAIAQDTAPEGFQLWTAASLTQVEQELKIEAANNPHHIGTRRLVDYPHDLFMLSRPESDGIVEWHENQADIFF